MFIDTHTHLYLNAFDEDFNQIIKNAIDKGVKYMLLPNIDSNSINKMLEICNDYPNNCFPMLGLHPTSVKSNFIEELKKLKKYLSNNTFYAIGEIGIDLYWDKTFIKEQVEAMMFQIFWAREYELPIVIHSRNSFNEVFKILNDSKFPGMRGVFHCFSGSVDQARKVIDELGFKLGIGGVVTFKNSGLDKVVKEIALENIVLETDSPFLAPMPFRGKRNESAYTIIIAEKIAAIKNISIEEVAETTTKTALELFKFENKS
ncbi:MAG: TatD family hydrolase [Bacteroidales bacterium]|nr:TatD family hydrolase [Bacteroidales bacterium]